MEAAKSTPADDKKAMSSENTVVNVEFALRTALHEAWVETDFVHSITGRILARADDETEQEIGRIEALLVQFAEAMDQGISSDRLGDGIDGNISEYWERLFDPNEGRLKEEILDEYEVLGWDLLIIDSVRVVPRFQGHGVGRAAIERAIEIFGAGCGLVACKPWPLQFSPAIAGDRTLMKTLNTPDIGIQEALSKLRRYWSELGFRPLGSTGIYILSTAVKSPSVTREHPKLSADPTWAAEQSVRTLPSNYDPFFSCI